MYRRAFMAGALAFGALFALPTSQAAADWKPSGPITLQIGFGAGGETDVLGRMLAATMEKQTGWKVVAENKPGGGGVAMFSGIAKAKPDGLTLGMGVNMPILINLLNRPDKLNFTIDSFDYLATVTRAQLAMVAKGDATFSDIKGLVEFARKNDGAVVAFDSGTAKLVLQFIAKQEGVKIKPLAVKSSAEMIQNVLGGHADASFAAGIHIPYLEKGELKLLASVNAERHTYAPDTPSLIEQGYNVYVDPYFYIAAPKGLPAEANAALAKALDDAVNSDDARKVIVNSMNTAQLNLGPEGTRNMLEDGMGMVKVLFGK